MKIIGTVPQFSDADLLVQISKSELKKVVGEHYPEKGVKVGDEIKVSSLYNHYHNMMGSKKNLNTIRDHCQEIFDAVSAIKPVVESLTDED